MLSYQLVFDFLRHHEETNNDRPLFIDHTIAVILIGTAVGAFWGGSLRMAFLGGFVGGFNIAPFTWMIRNHARMDAANRPSNIFY